MINHEYYTRWIDRSTLHGVVEEVRNPMPGTEQSDAEYASLRKAYYEAYDNIRNFLVGKDGISMERMRHMGDENEGCKDAVAIPGVKHFATNARNELLRAATKEDEAVKADEKVRELILAIARGWESLHGFVGLKLAGYMLIGAADCATDATDTFPAIIDEQGIYLYGHGFHGEKGSYEGTYAGEEYTCADYNQHLKLIQIVSPAMEVALNTHLRKCKEIIAECDSRAEMLLKRTGAHTVLDESQHSADTVESQLIHTSEGDLLITAKKHAVRVKGRAVSYSEYCILTTKTPEGQEAWRAEDGKAALNGDGSIYDDMIVAIVKKEHVQKVGE